MICLNVNLSTPCLGHFCLFVFHLIKWITNTGVNFMILICIIVQQKFTAVFLLWALNVPNECTSAECFKDQPFPLPLPPALSSTFFYKVLYAKLLWNQPTLPLWSSMLKSCPTSSINYGRFQVSLNCSIFHGNSTIKIVNKPCACGHFKQILQYTMSYL